MSSYELVVGKPVVQKNPKNTYLLEIEVMHGDGDNYQIINLDFKERKLLQVLPVLEELETNGRKYHREYRIIDGFGDLLQEDWPYDCTSEDYLAGYVKHKLFWYNEDGIKHNVKVKKVD